MALVITKPSPALSWSYPLSTRSSTTHLIIHHAAATGTVHTVHNAHIGNGWAGIAYNFYIRTDGTVYEGRGWDKCGGHTLSQNGINYNNVSIGICCEGNYDVTTAVPLAQRLSLIQLIAEAKSKYPTITSYGGHNNFNTGSHATACPGQYFPKDNAIDSGKMYGAVLSAAKTLKNKGIINTPEYWADNFFRLQYLGDLIIKMAAKCKNVQTNNVGTVILACNVLQSAGVIDTASYWINNANAVQYLSDLLISAAKRS